MLNDCGWTSDDGIHIVDFTMMQWNNKNELNKNQTQRAKKN